MGQSVLRQRCNCSPFPFPLTHPHHSPTTPPSYVSAVVRFPLPLHPFPKKKKKGKIFLICVHGVGVAEGRCYFFCYFLLFWGRRPHQVSSNSISMHPPFRAKKAPDQKPFLSLESGDYTNCGNRRTPTNRGGGASTDPVSKPGQKKKKMGFWRKTRFGKKKKMGFGILGENRFFLVPHTSL